MNFARGGLIVILSAWTTLSLLMVYSGLAMGKQFERDAAAVQASIWQPAAVMKFEGQAQRLVVPSWRLLDDDRLWAYVGSSKKLDPNFTPQLTEITDVAIGDWVTDKRLHPQALDKLRLFMRAADEAGRTAIVTSAYRSYSEQQSLKAEAAATYGAAYSQDYVAEPGRSEHQLGLAVDFSSYSPSCQAKFSNCSLSASTAKWLAAHAHEYGFILRYPDGKQAITGVSPESWHFRYVGPKLAQFIYDSGLTFDEVYQQLSAAHS